MAKLNRYYWIGSDLDLLEWTEEQLEAAGVLRPQIHVLTLDDSSAENHHKLHDVQSLMKKDLFRSGLQGTVIGTGAAALVLILAGAAGWTDTVAGWLPFVFLAIVLFGFFTWEGGLWGIQTHNAEFRRFQHALECGRHVFFADLESSQAEKLRALMDQHRSAEFAGIGSARPHWLMLLQHRLGHFFSETMP
jgi:hypothetical protein